jgi:putative membrane protein
MPQWRILLISLPGALVLSQALPALAQEGPPFGPRHFGAYPHGPWMWTGVGLFLLLRLLLVTGLVVLLWRLLSVRGLWQRPDPATQLLRERYARGEIGEEEFRKRLQTLA